MKTVASNVRQYEWGAASLKIPAHSHTMASPGNMSIFAIISFLCFQTSIHSCLWMDIAHIYVCVLVLVAVFTDCVCVCIFYLCVCEFVCKCLCKYARLQFICECVCLCATVFVSGEHAISWQHNLSPVFLHVVQHRLLRGGHKMFLTMCVCM